MKGGDKLAAKLKEIGARLGPNGALKVGFLEGATYPASGDDKEGLSVAQVAFWNEFGTLQVHGAAAEARGNTTRSGGVPPRPFFRNAIAQNSPNWSTELAAAVKLANYDTRKALTIMGDVVKGQIVKSILETNSPPLSEYTIKKKGFAKPLIDTGVMQRSVDYEVTGA